MDTIANGVQKSYNRCSSDDDRRNFEGRRQKAMLFAPKEKGQGLVEYALILVLVAIVVIVILALLGPAIGNVFSNVVSNI